MIEFIAKYGSNALSVTMILLVIFGAYKWRWTWIWGLFSQILWTVWIFASGEWGFIYMNLFMYVAYTFAHIKWERDRKNAGSKGQHLQQEVADT